MCFPRGCIQISNKLTFLSSPKYPQTSPDTPEMNSENIQGRNSYVQQPFLTKHHLPQISIKENTYVMHRPLSRQDTKAARELHWISKLQVITSHQPGKKYRFLYYFAWKIITRILTAALISSYI